MCQDRINATNTTLLTDLDFPDDFSSMEILQCRVNDGDEANIGAIADVVVDEELEVRDVEEGQTLRRFYSSFI